MLGSFLVIFICCVGFSVAQAAVIEDYRGCGPNEVYNECNPCPPEVTCYDDDHYICTRLYNNCQAGCVCKQGFIRKSVESECIPEKECSRRCGKNEIYTECKLSCSNETCASIGSFVKCDSKEPCKPGCICINGFFRNEEEDVEDPGCIIPRCLCLQKKGSPACSPWELHEPECGQNEVWECVYSCPPQKTCRTRENIIRCLEFVDICKFQCACEEGFVRNINGGECISEQQCDKCPGPNEHYACGGPCDNICHTLHVQNKTSCPHTYTDCRPSCFCDDGHARDDDGVCIPIENCRKDNII